MSRASTARPPSLPRLVLRLALPRGAAREAITGDLDDEFAHFARERSVDWARAWYRRQSRGVVLHYALRRRLGMPAGGRAPHSGRRGVPDSSSGNRLDSLLMDLKFALRGLRRDRGFAAVAILTLTIGIGANTAIFSVIDGVLLRPLPYSDPESLVLLMESHATAEGSYTPYAISPANFLDWQERNEVFTGVSLIADTTAELGEEDDPPRIEGLRVSVNFFEVLGVEAALGRTFRPDEAPPDSPAVVVISHGFWQRAFGADPEAVGKSLRLEASPHTVIGVMPPEFAFSRVRGGYVDPRMRDYFVPDPFGTLARDQRRYRSLSAVARLRPGISIEQADDAMDAIAVALAQEYPEINTNRLTGEPNLVHVESLHRGLVGTMGTALWMLMGAVALVLVIACANVGNLLLVRSTSRRREIALRTAIGAGRLRLARQMLTESLVLGTLGGLGGLLLARWTVPMILPLAPITIPPTLLRNVGIDARILVFTLAVCFLTAIAFGLAPALRCARSDPGPILRAGKEIPAPRRPLRGRQLVVAIEIGLALVLLVGLGLLASTFARLDAIPLGFDPGNGLYIVTTFPSEHRGPEGRDARIEVTGRLVERLQAVPEIEAASAVNMLPLRYNWVGGDIHIEGRPVHPESDATADGSGRPDEALLRVATPGYMEMMRIPILRGRAFASSDDDAAPPVAIINQAMAEEYWSGQSPLGRKVATTSRSSRDGDQLRFLEIVGVAGNVWERNHYAFTGRAPLFGSEIPATIYMPFAQRPASRSVIVVARHSADEAVVAAAMGAVVQGIMPDVRIPHPESLESYVDDWLVSGELRFCALLVGIASAIAVLLSLMGVYGAMAFDVTRRTHEIGVRMALGARAGSIVTAIVGQGLRLAVFGSVLGLLGAAATTRLLSRWLYGVSPTDPFVFASLTLAIIGVAVLACWIPARRAARVDPMTSLRAE